MRIVRLEGEGQVPGVGGGSVVLQVRTREGRIAADVHRVW